MPDIKQTKECGDKALVCTATKPNEKPKKLHLGFHNLLFDIPVPQSHLCVCVCVVRDISRYPISYYPQR